MEYDRAASPPNRQARSRRPGAALRRGHPGPRLAALFPLTQTPPICSPGARFRRRCTSVQGTGSTPTAQDPGREIQRSASLGRAIALRREPCTEPERQVHRAHHRPTGAIRARLFPGALERRGAKLRRPDNPGKGVDNGDAVREHACDDRYRCDQQDRDRRSGRPFHADQAGSSAHALRTERSACRRLLAPRVCPSVTAQPRRTR